MANISSLRFDRLSAFRRQMKGIRQPSTTDQHHNDPSAFSRRISQLLFQHLRLYTGWSLLNILVCLPFLIYSSGSICYFMLMNFTWGVVNTGFAGLFYWHIHAQRFLSETFEEQASVHRHICRMLVINIALDIAYALVGLSLLIFARQSPAPAILTAFGAAVMLQAVFLLVQDIWFHSKHRENSPS